MSPHIESKLIAEAFFHEVGEACKRIVNMDGERPDVVVKPTEYVVDGRTFTLKLSSGDFPFWLGLNGNRILFIVYVGEITQKDATEFYKFTFGGAHKMGWSVNVEPLSGASGVSIWSSCTPDTSKPLGTLLDHAGSGTTAEVTKEGLFWATDIALMVQSWIRTSERGGLKRHPQDPAPL